MSAPNYRYVTAKHGEMEEKPSVIGDFFHASLATMEEDGLEETATEIIAKAVYVKHRIPSCAKLALDYLIYIEDETRLMVWEDGADSTPSGDILIAAFLGAIGILQPVLSKYDQIAGNDAIVNLAKRLGEEVDGDDPEDFAKIIDLLGRAHDLDGNIA